MAMQADLLIDRRRLKRWLSLWRAAAVLLAIGLVLALVGGIGPGGGPWGGAHVARLELHGFIGDDARLNQALDRLRRDEGVRALLVSIDSPGGSVGGGEAM